MKIITKINICLYSIAILLEFNAFSWWDQSHELIGLIASENISEETYQKAKSLLLVPISFPGSYTATQNTNDFDTASTWPDVIKVYSEQMSGQTHSLCHYTDLLLEKQSIGTELGEQESKQALQTALKEKPINSISCLKGTIKTLVDDSQSELNKAIALRFLLHIMGDIAQPLHNVSLIENGRADAGGTKSNFPQSVGIPVTNGTLTYQSNLHALWDATLASYLQFPYEKKSYKLGKSSNNDRNLNKYYHSEFKNYNFFDDVANSVQYSHDSIENWIIEGYQIAAKHVYTNLNDPWEIYSVQRQELVKLQILKTSYKLAFLLEAIFSHENSTFGYKNIVQEVKKDSTIKPFIIKGAKG